ncbi:glutamine amidotransferase [candidate division TA06 bacterium DG_26]|uniref:Glutamine--fructose-6-phosphate aminotransferase [isomerizing] n=1 Tax=candidate division TA06 bacterium DG_26 TaxID=1703771 RepID=A0A0S7WGK7_UNCT6|nr:MAG: glutamine amidotransferase [candidate division TA06 bacterium DG_26]
MCGIVGYIGSRQAVPVLLEGLKRLEYRGYDSAGIAVLYQERLIVQKKAGKVSRLASLLAENQVDSRIGIAHTRWATHGNPTDLNAHPHVDCFGKIAVVHNGIIENHTTLRKFLTQRGHTLRTETDTEVLAHLIEEYYTGDLLTATRIALNEVEGTYGIAVLSVDDCNELIVAKNGSPLAIGNGDSEYIVASDVAAILPYTKKVIYLKDGELARITAHTLNLTSLQDKEIEAKVEEISWTLEMIERGGFPHFMLKEIYEQPDTLRNAMRGRLNRPEGTARLNGLRNHWDALMSAKKIILTACGTSWHAGLVGEYIIEDLARVPVEVEYASEFRYRNPVIEDDTVLIVISQSGETADTLAALREAKKRGATVLGVCNVVGSTIARETDGGVYIHAGPEIGVASTKAFTSQLMVLTLFSLLLGRMRGTLSARRGKEIVQALEVLPEQASQTLEIVAPAVRDIAERFCRTNNFLFLGRGYNFPVALEGALKLKEISYIHAEGYPAAEMKHGPIALIDEAMPVVFIAIRNGVYSKVLTNIEEVKARRGEVIAIATHGDEEIRKKAEHVVYVPHTLDLLTPLLTVIPLQLLAYHIAVLRKCDVDKPRNLAKSVTVE